MAASLKHSPLSLPKAAGSRAVDIALSASAEDLRAALLEQKAVSQEQALRLLYDWSYWARSEQMPPPGDWRVWAIITGRAWGKAACINTEIPTPYGWKRLGDVGVGDEVFDETGIVCRVEQTFDVAPEAAYCLTFSDGTTIDVCSEHLWTTWTHADRKALLRSEYEDRTKFPEQWPTWRSRRVWGIEGLSDDVIDETKRLIDEGLSMRKAAAVVGASRQSLARHLRRREAGRKRREPKVYEASNGPKVRTTQEIADTLRWGKRPNDNNHCIPVCGSLQLSSKDLIVSPYVLGAWLGDGNTANAYITACDGDAEEILCRFEEVGVSVHRNKAQRRGGRCALYPIGRTSSGGTKDGLFISEPQGTLLDKLRKLCVIGNKHIPPEYLRASIEQRIELLRGLMDTDGTCGTNGAVEYVSVIPELAHGVAELARTLGQKAVVHRNPSTLNGKRCKDKYRVRWTATINVFHLKRKAARLRIGQRGSLINHHRMIVSAERIPSKPMRCLTVDSPNGLFLATRAFIPTHNTRTGAEWIRQQAYEGHGPIALVSRTAADTRDVMIEGPAGIIACCPPWFMPLYEPSKRRLTFPQTGVVCSTFGGDEPDQLRGPQFARFWADEICLVSSTKIATKDGDVPISQVRPGMEVWTRQGLYPVLRSWMTKPDAEVYDLVLSDGRVITGTATHPVWVQGRGFVPLGLLGPGDSLLSAEESCQSRLFGVDKSGGLIPMSPTTSIEKENYYTGQSMNTTTAKLRRDFMFTTETRFVQTIGQKISLRCLPKNIKTNTNPGDFATTHTSKEAPIACRIGTRESRTPRKRFACVAEGHLFLPVCDPSSAPTHAEPNTIGPTGHALTTITHARDVSVGLFQSKECNLTAPQGVGVSIPIEGGLTPEKNQTCSAAYAATPFDSLGLKERHAQKSVATPQGVCVREVRRCRMRQAVYNFEVAGVHEYFANGILVKNCKWSRPDDAFSNLEMGMRIGNNPRGIITTTPRPIKLLKELLKDPRVFVQRGHSYENKANLPPDFIERVENRYAGTRLGRQELEGELLDDTPGAIFSLKVIDEHRVRPSQMPSMRQVVVGVDPSAADYDPDNEDKRGAECGIIVAGVGGHEDHGYVLHDASDMMSPHDWAEKVVAMYYKFNANYVVAEKNNGGGMVRETIHAIDDRVPVMLVWASQGKEPRAEPVSLLYEQGRVHHVGSLPDLEDQMSSFVPRDKRRQPSDRMDALVWAIKHLMLGDDKMPHYDPTRHVMPRWRRPEQ